MESWHFAVVKIKLNFCAQFVDNFLGGCTLPKGCSLLPDSLPGALVDASPSIQIDLVPESIQRQAGCQKPQATGGAQELPLLSTPGWL